MCNEKNYYQILQISESAEDVVIQAAYRALAKRYHPDVSQRLDAKEMFQSIQEAYEALSNKERTKEQKSPPFRNADDSQHFSQWIFYKLAMAFSERNVNILDEAYEIFHPEKYGFFSIKSSNNDDIVVFIVLYAKFCRLDDYNNFDCVTDDPTINESVEINENIQVTIRFNRDNPLSLVNSKMFKAFVNIISQYSNRIDGCPPLVRKITI